MADVSKIKLPNGNEYNIKDYRIPGVDTTPTSGSDNIVTSGGVYDKINDESLVISTALNDLNNRLTEVEGNTSNVDETPTEDSTNLVTSGGIYTAIVENELATASALNDLNERIDNIESTVGDDSEFVKISDYEDDQETTAAALNDLNDKINDIDDAFGDGDFVKVPDYEEDQEVITRGINDLNNRITTIEDDGIITEPFSEIDPVSVEYYTKVEIDDLLSEIDVEETDPVFSASPAANITASDITNWNNKTSNIGTVTQVNVGSTSYNPSNGVVSLPAYPTTLPASDVSAWAKASTKPTYTASEVGALPSTTVIPDAQVQSDWNATSGMGVILNKPTIPTIESLTTSEIDTIWNNAT